jgi:pre-mRNA-splicing factor CDC5/CEF1
MVRVFIKGGVWKNSEDEILKAAIMKYGKQQWARVASLLNRKSAKQCKARWNEWLDPSIRKVEWSRAEDEKLLHLAKLMPAQWKTIGPLVGGRTAVQSQERYETLLDQAASASGGGGEDNDAEGEEGMASSARKLRTGDIDPHPETKPARPDPIDMDEDEIEMLQEARARLANTQGKKAKRKAREKMLNEAKRLADLQKRRELKQAGLLSSAARTKMLRGKKRRREIDYGTEIPFHKPAPAGFHSTGEEDERADIQRSKRMKEIDFKKINEAQYRSRDREEKSAQRKEEARLRALEKSNMQYVVAEVSKKNDPIAARKRGILSMPAPSVTDEELEKVAKLTKEQRADNSAILSSSTGGSATDALLGDYSDRPLPTPMRTPMSKNGPSSQEVIMREASNLRMLERGQTPLLGGDNPSFGEADGGGLGNFPSSGAATPMIGTLSNNSLIFFTKQLRSY